MVGVGKVPFLERYFQGMAFNVREFFHNSTFTVPSGVTQIFWEFAEEHDPDCTFMAAGTSPGFAPAFYIRSDGTALCVGNGLNGQLGNNASTSRSTPVLNARPQDAIRRIFLAKQAPGSTTSVGVMVLSTAGNVPYAWGGNTSGLGLPLGSSGTLSYNSPNYVGTFPNSVVNFGLHSVTFAPYLSPHGIAVARDGKMYSWGANTAGQLGDNTVVAKTTPTLVVGNRSWMKAANSTSKSTAIDTDGRLFAWGNQNPDTGVASRSSPVQILPANRFIDVKMYTNMDSGYMAAALDTNHQLWTWGQAAYFGNTGLGTRHTPAVVNNMPQIAKFDILSNANYPYYSCITLTRDGEVYGWGENVEGELGDGTQSIRNTPTRIVGHKFVKLKAQETTVAALKSDGTLWHWGRHPITGSATTTPTQLIPTPNVTFIDLFVTSQNIWGLSSQGLIYGYGNNLSGQMATNTTTPVSPIQQLTGLSSNGVYFGGSGVGKHAFGMDQARMSGVMEVVPGQVLNIMLGALPMIAGLPVFQTDGLDVNSALAFFARSAKIGWVD